MFDHNHGLSGGLDDLFDRVMHFDHAFGIEVGGRFVQQQQTGLHSQHAGQRETLTLTAGQDGRVDRSSSSPPSPTISNDSRTRCQISSRRTLCFRAEGRVIAQSFKNDRESGS